jgi:hypothetical protein
LGHPGLVRHCPRPPNMRIIGRDRRSGGFETKHAYTQPRLNLVGPSALETRKLFYDAIIWCACQKFPWTGALGDLL